MAALRSRSDSPRLFVDLRAQGRRHRRQTALLDTPANRRLLQRTLESINASSDLERLTPLLVRPQGLEDLHAIPTLARFASTWFEQASVGWSSNTRRSMRTVLDVHLLPTLGSLRLTALTRAQVMDLRAHLASQLSARTLNRVMGVLASLMREARLQHPEVEPLPALPRLREPPPAVTPFTPDQIARVLAAAPDAWRPYLQLRFFTALRPGEIDALRWSQVDAERGVLQITQARTRGCTGAPKTATSRRTVTLNALARAALECQAQRTGRDPEQLVFQTPSGAPVHAENFRLRVWAPLLERLGLPYRAPYQTRHTCASLWLACGESPEWIARQLGHADTAMLFRAYSRFAPNLGRHDGQAFEQMAAAWQEGSAGFPSLDAVAMPEMPWDKPLRLADNSRMNDPSDHAFGPAS